MQRMIYLGWNDIGDVICKNTPVCFWMALLRCLLLMYVKVIEA